MGDSLNTGTEDILGKRQIHQLKTGFEADGCALNVQSIVLALTMILFREGVQGKLFTTFQLKL